MGTDLTTAAIADLTEPTLYFNTKLFLVGKKPIWLLELGLAKYEKL